MTVPTQPTVPTGPQTHILDNPAWASLSGVQADLGETTSRAGRYLPTVSPFGAVSDPTDPLAWADLAGLIAPGGGVAMTAEPDDIPSDWEDRDPTPGVQLVPTDALVTGPFAGAVELGADDASEMVDLVTRTRPGPFFSETHRMGRYLGIRSEAGALVAMAGERLHPPGWTEISAVCTDPGYRGRGYARALVGAVAHEIFARGESPFMHAAASNTSAIELYLRMGFVIRRTVDFHYLRPIRG
ncbi:GNAT family N-acetyltransferase [Gordonia soli]|uniref:Putative acetyltransferase n=1 Tax=Gordonia soli NBRC 108243 TaxID=1223545 RepID=M0QH48_9ACTN|nr:GNAT family N-acetyltransferase [Gordonia soli]GAC67950.1 putative acetyltransferase [Gordonia soli NBRC 108243]